MYVFTKSGRKGQLEKEYSKYNISIIPFKTGYFNVSSIIRLYYLFRQQQFSSVVDFTGNFAGGILFASYLAKVKTRIAFYRNASTRFSSSPLKNLYNLYQKKLVNLFASKILFNSHAGLNHYFPNSKMGNRFKVIYNGIDITEFRQSKAYSKNMFNIPEGAFVVGHTGRVNPAKNHDTILKVAKEIINKFNDVYFLLCGKNTDLLFEKFSIEKDFSSRIIVLGYREDIQNILPVFDLFFFPSLTEGQPNSLIEAMACNIPILASNIDPIKEVLPITMHDQLIAPKDSKSFVDKIEEMYKNKKKIKTTELKDWVSSKFNHRIQFNKFFVEL